MHSQTSETQQTIPTGRRSPHGRGNYSKCGRLFDQNFYLECASFDPSLISKVQMQIKHKRSPKQSTIGFSSVSREKKQNLRFSIPQGAGQFTYHPDHFFGRSRSPTWSFSKKQRYGNQKIQQYEICRKHPIARQKSQEKMFNSTSSIKQTLKGNLSLMKSISMNQTMDHTKNYSIIAPRRASAVNFFSKTKIKNPFYLSKKQVMNEQEKLQTGKQIQPCPKGYIQFFKKRTRHLNKNVKGFQTFLYSNNDEKQFNNFSMTQHPTSPKYHIDFQKHLWRDSQPKDTKCPNLQVLNIDPIRVRRSQIDLNTTKFRQKITTRYDRVGPEPNTRIDYDPPKKSLSGMVKMQKVLSRNRQLFPIVDPAIKKAGDAEAKQKLRQYIPVKQINEAMRPKCNTKIQL